MNRQFTCLSSGQFNIPQNANLKDNQKVQKPQENLTNWTIYRPERIGDYMKSGVAPMIKDNLQAIALMPDRDSVGEKAQANAVRKGLSILLVSRPQFAYFAQATVPSFLNLEAGRGLYERDKLNSALHGIQPVQYVVCALLLIALICGFVISPGQTLAVVATVLIAILFVLVLFRFACMASGPFNDLHGVGPENLAALKDEDLPTYTVMVPMLRERESTLRGLASALAKLDYPTDRLQVQFILEETDTETRKIVDNLTLPEWLEVILIPDGEPHTKGKACNYALNFVSGELFTIYDAEDRPDPLQLKKAVIAFRETGPDVVCAQSKLNFYNTKENWLTRMFTLGYTVWYDLMLPGMEFLGLPICLGGTSNHFVTQEVRNLNGWDAYNVTEDADLGLRIAKKGKRTIILDSTTFEEANTQIPNWIRQRTRWMKGYMLTYLVHMRQPLKLLRTFGLRRFAGMQLFVAGNFVGNLINLPLWLITILWASDQILPWSDVPLFPDRVWYPAMFCLLVGNGAAIGFIVLAAYRRKRYDLILYALTAPVYWVLATYATYRALYQLFTNPFHWEKTEHGLTKISGPDDQQMESITQRT